MLRPKERPDSDGQALYQHTKGYRHRRRGRALHQACEQAYSYRSPKVAGPLLNGAAVRGVDEQVDQGREVHASGRRGDAASARLDRSAAQPRRHGRGDQRPQDHRLAQWLSRSDAHRVCTSSSGTEVRGHPRVDRRAQRPTRRRGRNLILISPTHCPMGVSPPGFASQARLQRPQHRLLRPHQAWRGARRETNEAGSHPKEQSDLVPVIRTNVIHVLVQMTNCARRGT